MKAKYITKIMFIIIAIIAILLLLISTTQASGYSNNVFDWKFDSPTLPTLLAQGIGIVISVLRNIAIIITVLTLTILGVKYMMGSVEEKAEYKKDYVNIIIGVVLITGIFSILSALFSIAEGMI